MNLPFDLLQSILRQLDRLLLFLNLNPFGALRLKRHSKTKQRTNHNVHPTSTMRPLLDLQREALSLFTEPCNIQRMMYMSTCLKHEYQNKLNASTACMLPSFCHTLPSGLETGTFVALDLGGSTFRVAIVELSTRQDSNGGMEIRHITSHKINEHIRQFESKTFFAWMAGKIHDTLSQYNTALCGPDPISIGLTWSFPIEQTSYRGGTVQAMGKGFRAHEGIVGQDLGNLVELACRDRGLNVCVHAIINDSSATLLSQAYSNPTTSMGLILGTGTNAAVYLPVKDIGLEKFGVRDPTWFLQAEKVIVNTEVSMFGKGILPETRWDEQLNRVHCLPDFQPLEYMTTGRYLGEIFRLVIAEAVTSCQMFGGDMPETIRNSYTVDTALLAAIEEDSTVGYISAAERVQKEFKLYSLPTPTEMSFMRAVVEAISHRAAAYTATAVHALWSLEHDETNNQASRTTVAANGSVVQMYPGFRTRCQQYANDLISQGSTLGGVPSRHEIIIEPAYEAAIFGAAVAVAISDAAR